MPWDKYSVVSHLVVILSTPTSSSGRLPEMKVQLTDGSMTINEPILHCFLWSFLNIFKPLAHVSYCILSTVVIYV